MFNQTLQKKKTVQEITAAIVAHYYNYYIVYIILIENHTVYIAL